MKLAELYRQLGLMSRCDAALRGGRGALPSRRQHARKRSRRVKKLVDLDPENIATRIKLAELYSKEGDRATRPSTSSPYACEQLRRQGASGRLHQGRRAAAVAQAGQPRAATASSPGCTCAATIRGARCRSCRRASRRTRATSRRSACSRRRSRRSIRRPRRSACSRSSRASSAARRPTSGSRWSTAPTSSGRWPSARPFHTGQTVEQIEADSDRDRWFTADEAKDYGFVDQVVRSANEVPSEGPVS